MKHLSLKGCNSGPISSKRRLCLEAMSSSERTGKNDLLNRAGRITCLFFGSRGGGIGVSPSCHDVTEKEARDWWKGVT